jgi:hypothetical protein
MRPVVSVDVGDEGGDASAVLTAYGSFVEKIELWEERTVVVTGREAFDYAVGIGARELRFDSIGVGSGALASAFEQQQLRQEEYEENKFVCQYPPMSIDILGIKLNKKMFRHGTSRDKAYMQLASCFSDNSLFVPPNYQLRRQLMIVQYAEAGGKVVVTSKRQMRSKLGGASPNEMEALVLLKYGAGISAGSV